MSFMKKLIIIRGNSGSGKSTIARAIQEELRGMQKVALIEQDYLRRVILKEKESEGSDNIDLIENTAKFAIDRGYLVVLEGILVKKRYHTMLQRLREYADVSRTYYFDLSFEETLRRHQGKVNTHDFGENEMRGWWTQGDVLGGDDILIGEEMSKQQITDKIISDIEAEDCKMQRNG